MTGQRTGIHAPTRAGRPEQTHIRVLIADDHEVVAQALRQLLAMQPDIEVVGLARDGHEAVARARDLQPDVVLMDVIMPGLGGIEATRLMREALPQCRVVIHSLHSDAEHVRAALRAGAAGYVPKCSAASETLAAIRAVHAGKRFLAAELAGSIVGAGDISEPVDRLCDREREVPQRIDSADRAEPSRRLTTLQDVSEQKRREDEVRMLLAGRAGSAMKDAT